MVVAQQAQNIASVISGWFLKYPRMIGK